MSKPVVATNKSTNGRVAAMQQTFNLFSRIAPGLAALLAEKVFLTPIRHRRPEREAAWEGTARPFEVDTPNGGRLKAWVWGEGRRTALLVHGWAGRGLQLGALAQPLVDSGYRVVTFDGPAHGRSSGRSTNLPDFAAAIGRVALDIGGVDLLVAHSFGSVASLVAMSRGLVAPSRVVMVASPSSFSMILGQFSQMTGFTAEVMERMATRLGRRFDFEWADLEPRRLASGTRVPALIVHDLHDDSIPFSEGRALAEAWPGARLLQTEDLGHFRILRNRQVIAETVGFALSESPGRRTHAAYHQKSVPAPSAAQAERTAASRILPRSDRLDFSLSDSDIASELAFGRD